VTDPTEPSATPDFLNHDRPPVPHLTVPRGVQPFHLESKPVRGRLVRLGPLADALLTRHDNPPAVNALLGEALALTAGLSTALKFQGSFSLQAKGDGPVSMLLADCTEGGALRGYARVEAESLPEGEKLPAETLLGQGYLAFTVDQGAEMDRYQGIVAIEGKSLAEMTGHYFATSEQLASRVWLAAARTEAGWRAAALILERVATEGGMERGESGAWTSEDADAWETALALAATVTEAELLDDNLPPERLLYRLFHAEGLVVDRPRPLSYGCRCSRSRLASVLSGFGAEDLDHMAEDGTIIMTCEFCNVGFRFERSEVQAAT